MAQGKFPNLELFSSLARVWLDLGGGVYEKHLLPDFCSPKSFSIW
jgi:hypothetical protein